MYMRALVAMAPSCVTMCVVIVTCAVFGTVEESALVSAVSVLAVSSTLFVVGVVQGVRSVVTWFRRRPVIARARVVRRR